MHTHHINVAARRELMTEYEDADPAVRLAAALGRVEHLLPNTLVPGSVLDALAATLDVAGEAYTARWGNGWDEPLAAAIRTLHDRPADQVALLLRIPDHPRLRRAWIAGASTVLDHSPQGGKPLVPALGRLLLDPDPTVRDDAARALAYPPGPVIRPAADRSRATPPRAVLQADR